MRKEDIMKINKIASELIARLADQFSDIPVEVFHKTILVSLGQFDPRSDLSNISSSSADKITDIFSSLTDADLFEWFEGLLLQESPGPVQQAVSAICIFRGKIYRDSSMTEEVPRIDLKEEFGWVEV